MSDYTSEEFTRILQQEKKVVDDMKEKNTIATTQKESFLKQKGGLEAESLALKVKPENLETEQTTLRDFLKENFDKLSSITTAYKKAIEEMQKP